MKKLLKKAFLGFSRVIGYERFLLHNMRFADVQLVEVMKWLFNRNAELLYIDVGTNEGQTIDTVKKRFPAARFYSFEPSPSLQHALLERYGKDPNVHLFFCALGDHQGTIQLHTSEFSPTNSVLAADASTYRLFGYVKVAAKLEQEQLCDVEMTTLATWAETNLKNDDTVDVLKIDTQGYEYQVLAGAGSLLERTKMVIIKAQFQSFYRDATPWTQSYKHLHNRGFYLLDFFSHSRFKNTVLLECDLIFLNPAYFPPDAVRDR